MRKRTVEECLRLTLRLLARCRVVQGATLSSGVVQWPSGSSATAEPFHVDQQATLKLRYSVNQQEVSCTIPLSPRWPHFGGQTWWLHCPYCRRRGFKLYLPPGVYHFRCRQCYDLTYASCQKSHCWDGLDRKMAAMLNRAGHRGMHGLPYTSEDVARALAGQRKLMRGRPALPE